MPRVCSIRIGITGHRDRLPPIEDLKINIEKVLSYEVWLESQQVNVSVFDLIEKEILDAFGRKEIDLRFVLLTPLAEGADRIVAEGA